MTSGRADKTLSRSTGRVSSREEQSGVLETTVDEKVFVCRVTRGVGVGSWSFLWDHPPWSPYYRPRVVFYFCLRETGFYLVLACHDLGRAEETRVPGRTGGFGGRDTG